MAQEALVQCFEGLIHSGEEVLRNKTHLHLSGFECRGQYKVAAEQCGTSVAMIEKHYGRYIKGDGDAPLRDLLGAKSETLGETLLTVTRGKRRQVAGNSREERWSGRLDLNQRLHGPEPCALPS